MKKIELVYREILYRAMEKKEFVLTQSELSRNLRISLSIINKAVNRLNELGAVKIVRRNFKVLDIKKILFLWASIRNLNKDIILKTRVEIPVREIERNMPDKVVFTAYSAYKFKFKDIPADYSEVYIYANPQEIEEIKKRLFNDKDQSTTRPNLFILKKDLIIEKYDNIPISQIFVDLWNLGEWYSKEFINAFERRILD